MSRPTRGVWIEIAFRHGTDLCHAVAPHPGRVDGSYAVEDGVIHAQLSSDLEQSTLPWDFRIAIENETAELEMEYKDMTLYWIYGEQEGAANGTDDE